MIADQEAEKTNDKVNESNFFRGQLVFIVLDLILSWHQHRCVKLIECIHGWFAFHFWFGKKFRCMNGWGGNFNVVDGGEI
jgi:hypothetical protein